MSKDDTPDELMSQPVGRLHMLNEISRVVSSTLDLRTLYDTIYEQVGRVMDTSQFYIALHGPKREWIELPYVREEGRLLLDESIPYGNNITSYAVEKGITLLYHTTEEYLEFERQHGLEELIIGEEDSQSGIFVPLSTGNRTIGTLTVQSQRPGMYSQDDVHTLTVIAAQAAIAIENARLYEQSQHSVRQMQVLLHIARITNSSLDLQAVLDAILSGMHDVMPYHVAEILLPDYGKDHLDVVGSTGHLAEERRAQDKIPFGRGVVGTVFVTGKPAIVPNVREAPDHVRAGLEGAGSQMAVPLKRGDSVVGVLNVEREEVDSFGPADLDLLTLFASQAAIAIENARLFGEQRNRVYELQTIQSIVQKLTTLHDVHAIALVIEREVKQLIDYHACRLFLLDQDTTLLPLNPNTSAVEHPRLKVGEGVAGWIALHSEAIHIPNSLLDARGRHIIGTPKRAESIIGAPLKYEDRVQGVITLSKLGVDQFDENALRLLEIIAAQTAIAFDRARLYEELRAQAVTDELTKLYNRRYLLDRFKEEKARAVRNQHNLAAMMVDIDRFKDVNDTHGHDAGDVVLQDLATVIRAAVRIEDIVTRYGGEEFCILLPEIAIEDAEGVAERMRALIERRRFPKAAGVDHITVSVGLALLGPKDEDSELFTRADQAMYQVKRRGGNGVCVSEGDGFRELRVAL